MSEFSGPENRRLSASVCGNLVDPVQMQIVYALGHGQLSVGQLAGALGLSVSDIRRNLQALCQSQLVVSDYSWPTTEYRLSNRRLLDALDILQAVTQNTLPETADIALLRPYLWTQPMPDNGC